MSRTEEIGSTGVPKSSGHVVAPLPLEFAQN